MELAVTYSRICNSKRKLSVAVVIHHARFRCRSELAQFVLTRFNQRTPNPVSLTTLLGLCTGTDSITRNYCFGVSAR